MVSISNAWYVRLDIVLSKLSIVFDIYVFVLGPYALVLLHVGRWHLTFGMHWYVY